MFGMEKNKKGKKTDKIIFDMETSLKNDPRQKKELIKNMGHRVDTLKAMLREGKHDKKEFEQLSLLLHGYNSMIKVIKKI